MTSVEPGASHQRTNRSQDRARAGSGPTLFRFERRLERVEGREHGDLRVCVRSEKLAQERGNTVRARSRSGEGQRRSCRFRVRPRTSLDIRDEREGHTASRENKSTQRCSRKQMPIALERERSAGSPVLDQTFCVWAAGRKTAARWSRYPRQEVRSSVRRARTERRPCATERLLRKSLGQQRERASSEVRPDPATGLREGAK